MTEPDDGLEPERCPACGAWVLGSYRACPYCAADWTPKP